MFSSKLSRLRFELGEQLLASLGGTASEICSSSEIGQQPDQFLVCLASSEEFLLGDLPVQVLVQQAEEQLGALRGLALGGKVIKKDLGPWLWKLIENKVFFCLPGTVPKILRYVMLICLAHKGYILSLIRCNLMLRATQIRLCTWGVVSLC